MVRKHKPKTHNDLNQDLAEQAKDDLSETGMRIPPEFLSMIKGDDFGGGASVEEPEPTNDLNQDHTRMNDPKLTLEVNDASMIQEPARNLNQITICLTPTNGSPIRRTLSSNVEITIGRNTKSIISLKGNLVSRNHASITFKDGEVFIRDLNSKNGVYVNGNRIESEQQIFPEDIIQIGDYTFRMSYEQ